MSYETKVISAKGGSAPTLTPQMVLDATGEIMREVRGDLIGRIDSVKSLAISASRAAQASKRQQAPIRKTLVRAATARLICFQDRRDPMVFAEEQWKSGHVSDAVFNPGAFVAKATTAPAQTNVSGWASELAGNQGTAGAIASLAPNSVYAALAARGLRVPLAPMSRVVLPYRASPGPTASPFIGEGQPLPVRQWNLAAGSIAPAKCGAISLFSSELRKYSVPAIEAVVGKFLEEDLSIGIDGVLLSDSAGTAVQPPGLLHGVSPVTAATGTGLEALTADIGALFGAIVPAPADPVLVLNSADYARAILLSPNLAQAATVIVSESAAAGTVILLDGADFVSATGDDATIDIAEDATVISSDPALPVALGASGAGADTGSPHTSLYQLDLLGVRILESISWSLRRPNRISYVEQIAW